MDGATSILNQERVDEKLSQGPCPERCPKALLEFSEWTALLAHRPILHIQVGAKTLPVFREEDWKSFHDVSCGVEAMVLLLGRGSEGHRSWMKETNWQPGEAMLCVGKVLLWRTPSEATFGTFFITDRRAGFLPSDGSSVGRFEWPTHSVHHVQRDNCDLEQLVLREGSREFVISGIGGEAFVEEVRLSLEESGALANQESLEGGQAVSSILGESCVIRVFHGGELIKEIESGQLLALDEGASFLGLVYPGLPAALMEQEPTLRFEIRKWDAIYQFVAEIAKVHRSPKYVEEQVGSSTFILAFMAPLDIRRFNRREAFRVTLVEPEPVSIRNSEEEFSGMLLDISTAGSALLTDQLLGKGDELQVRLGGEARGLSITGTVVNCSLSGSGGNQWRYGLRFQGSTSDEMEALQEMVMRFQRDLLTDVANRRIFV